MEHEVVEAPYELLPVVIARHLAVDAVEDVVEEHEGEARDRPPPSERRQRRAYEPADEERDRGHRGRQPERDEGARDVDRHPVADQDARDVVVPADRLLDLLPQLFDRLDHRVGMHFFSPPMRRNSV